MTTQPDLWAIVLAAGQSSRLSGAGLEEKKQFLRYQNVPLFWHSVRTFSRIAPLAGIILVFPEDDYARAEQETRRLHALESISVPVTCVAGGERRQDSVAHGLQALPVHCARVLVHDAARPFFSPALVNSLLGRLDADQGGVIPSIPVTDTVKEIREGHVVKTLDRSMLAAVQTPQLFVREILVQSHKQAAIEGWEVTDDASMVEQLGQTVCVVPGELKNIKITTPEDLTMLDTLPASTLPVTGFGYDVHAYKGERPMILGGIPIPGGPTVKAHSDGDVLMHALCDAILGCLGQGDIGDLFPDTDDRFAAMPSSVFLAEVLDRALQAGVSITHVDLTIVAQVPRISPFKAQIKKNIASLMALSAHHVNIKATTEEGLGFTGTKKGIKAVAVVTGTLCT